MSDRLYLVHSGAPIDEVNPETIVQDLTAAVQKLEDLAENRPMPLALDWSGLRVEFKPYDRPFPRLEDAAFEISISAPVL